MTVEVTIAAHDLTRNQLIVCETQIFGARPEIFQDPIRFIGDMLGANIFQ